MANVVDSVERDGVKVLVYDNGMERSAETGRITKPADSTLITEENASDFHRARREKKYERARAGANRALAVLRDREYDEEKKKWVDVGPKWVNPQDFDYVEAIVEAQAAQALLVGDPSSTKAASFVFDHTGIGERQAQSDGPGADTTNERRALADMAAILKRVLLGDPDSADVIDGSTIPAQLHETNRAENE